MMNGRKGRLNEELPAGAGVEWAPKSYVGLKAIVERTIQQLNFAATGAAADCIDAWWATKGETPGQATIGISVADEFLRNAYTEGTYYVRIRARDDDEDPIYHTCKASPFPEAEQPQGFGFQRLERAMSAGLDTLEGLNATLSKSSKTYIEEADLLRREGHRKDGRIAELERQVSGLEGALASEKENNADIFDEETGMQILQVVQMWAAQPNGPAATMLARMFGANLKLFSALQMDKVIMRRILDPENPANLLEAFRGFAAEFNAIAREADAKGHDGRVLALMPGPSTADAAAAQAAAQRVTVQPTIAKAKPKGGGGKRNGKSSNGKSNGAREQARARRRA